MCVNFACVYKLYVCEKDLCVSIVCVCVSCVCVCVSFVYVHIPLGGGRQNVSLCLILGTVPGAGIVVHLKTHVLGKGPSPTLCSSLFPEHV